MPGARWRSSSGRRTTPTSRWPTTWLAYAEIESGQFEEALLLLGRGRELFGAELGKRDDARFSIEEARALVGLERHAEAARAASRALELLDAMQPADRGRAYVMLGGRLSRRGRP